MFNTQKNNKTPVIMKKKLSYMSLEPHLKNLRFCGFYQLNVNSLKRHKIIHSIYMRLVLLFILLYTVQQIMKVYQVRDDADKVMDTMFLLLTNSDSIYKQVVLWWHADKIESLFDIMKGPIFNQGVPKHEVLLSATVRQSRLFLWVFNTVALSTCLLWVLYPVMLFSQGKPVEFAIWLPFDANMSPHFYAVIVYVWIQTSWLAFNNTTMDAFISVFLAQCKTQLSILRLDLKNVVRDSRVEAHCLSMPFTEVHRKRFYNKILLHYNEIMFFSRTLQEIFGGALLYQFFVSGWIICTTAYRTVNINPASMEFISMIMYMCCIVSELFLFCYFGHEVNWESQSLTESAYAIDWLQLPAEQRKDLVIFMERIKKPIKPMAGAFIPLSNSTFVSIMKSSYSYYVFLNNTDE